MSLTHLTLLDHASSLKVSLPEFQDQIIHTHTFKKMYISEVTTQTRLSQARWWQRIAVVCLTIFGPPQNECQVRVDHNRLQLALWRVKSNSWLRRRDIRGIKTTRPWVLNCVAFECFWCFLPCVDVFYCFSFSRTMCLKYVEILWQDMQSICGWSWKAESWVMLSQYAQPFSCRLLTNPSWRSEFGSWLRLKT